MGVLVGAIARMLWGLIGPLAIKVLITLGIGSVTYSGATALINSLVYSIMSSVSTLPASILCVFNLAGFTDVVGIIVAAITARLTIRFFMTPEGTLRRFGPVSSS